ncbi:MAG: twin-arginine translocation signal domain-containing protein [Deltaproteobacteria bacterium]|nr:twin-arginine translocation signal domain-containing protein [Deltaproteobacteria bacterium]
MMKLEIMGNRRTFIKTAALLGGVAALFGSGRPAAAKPKPSLPKPVESNGGYRLTEHIKNYYRTARL